LPEFGYKPVNKYLPPRPRRDGPSAQPARAPAPPASATTSAAAADKLFAWVDRMLSR